MNYARRDDRSDIPVSAEELNAFIDDELIPEDRQRVRQAIKAAPELTQLICDIDQIQDWVREAYQTVPESRKPALRGRIHAMMPRALAAMALLSVGALAGWSAGKLTAPDTSSAAAIVPMLQANNVRAASSGAAAAQSRNVLLRLGSDSPEKFRETLQVVEHLLKTSANEPNFQLEVLTNSDGLSFLRADTSPYARQIEALMAKHPNVHFMVCGASLKKLEKSGTKLNLLPNVTISSSAVEQVAHRVREGWTYFAI